MSGLKRLIHEVHRRSLWQVLLIYAAAAWAVLAAVDTLAGALGLPEWAPPFALFLLIVGLPIVLATAFVQEGIGARPQPTASPPVAAPAPGDEVRVAPEPVPPRGSHHRLFTWRNAILGGVCAFALLGVGTAGWMAMRALGIGPVATLMSAGVLEDRERILVADFSSATGDFSLANVVTEAFRVDLSQSPVVVLVDPARVATTLGRMDRAPGTRLDLILAREVAQRDGIKVVLGGQVDAAGSGYVLTASLVTADDGEVLVSARETAANADDLIEGIDELSEKVRERIGESLRSLRRTPPLERVTTPSLEALRYYSQAERAALMQGQGDRAIALLEEAISFDTAFAMAWRKLAVVLGNRGEERSRSLRAFERALAHADRLPDRERFLTQGTYYQAVTGEVDKAITAYENLLAIDPEAQFALHNLALAYQVLRDPDRAVELYASALAMDSSALSLANLAVAQVSQGEWVDAEATLQQFSVQFPNNALGPYRAAFLATAQGDYEAARASLEALERGQAGSLYWTGLARLGLASIDATTGRLAAAAERFDEARALAEARALPSEALRAASYLALMRVLVGEDATAGSDIVEGALREYPMEDVDPLDWPYLEVAAVYAVAGQASRAQEVFDDFETIVPSLVLSGFSPEKHYQVRGEIALAEGRYVDAEDAFRQADTGYCGSCALPGLARTLDRAGRVDDALEQYERYLETPTIWRLGRLGSFMWPYGDWLFLGPAYERLGQLYDELGDLENAARYYALFTELWAEADEELQPRVRDAQTRLEEILRERG